MEFTVTPARALLCLVSLTIGTACVDLSPPWAKGSPLTGGSVGTSLDAGANPDGNLGGNTADAASTGGSGGNGGASPTDGSGATWGIGVFDALGTGGSISAGGGMATIDAAGGAPGSDGAVGIDSLAATGGSLPLGGSATVDATAGAGGVPSSGGTLGTGGSTSSGGTLASGGSIDSGSPSTGGTPTTGGTTATGGTPTTGGTTATGGSTTTGGTVGTGGTTAAACGTTKSTFSETVTFSFLDGGASPLGISPSPTPAGASLGYTTVGPASNPTLCNAGCATLSMAFTSGMTSYKNVSVIQGFASVIDLVAGTITFSVAIDNPGVPIQVQLYATGDASTSWAWATPTTVSGAALDSYAAATGFKDLSLVPADGTTNKYCSSASAIIGLQLQNTVAITAANAGTVTIYIGKIAVKPPA